MSGELADDDMTPRADPRAPGPGASLAAWAALALLAAGCFGERPVPGVDEVVEVPETFQAPQGPPVEQPPLDAWCSDFNHPGLEDMIGRAFEDNLDLKASWARLSQTFALLRQTRSNLYPTLDAEVQASVRRQQFFIPGPDGLIVSADVLTQYSPSLGAAYEIDLWGKLAARREAARLDFESSRADVQTLALSLTSQLAEAFFDVLAQRQKRALLREQIELNERYVALLELRLSKGVATALDVNQQRQQIEQLRAQLDQIDQAEALAAQRLALLVGEPPVRGAALVGEVGDELPALPALPGAGVPADLLERRPDLRAARRRLEAANTRVTVAIRERLPTIRLTASLFFQGQELGRLFEELLWSAAASIVQPIFQGDRLRAEVARAEAAQQEALYTYGTTLLTALSEVEGAMVSEHYQAQFIEDLERQRELASGALELARARYQRGALDFLRVLTALQSLQQIEQSLVDARRRQLSNRIQLCQALGGSWTRQLQPPDEIEQREDLTPSGRGE